MQINDTYCNSCYYFLIHSLNDKTSQYIIHYDTSSVILSSTLNSSVAIISSSSVASDVDNRGFLLGGSAL